MWLRTVRHTVAAGCRAGLGATVDTLRDWFDYTSLVPTKLYDGWKPPWNEGSVSA